MEQNNQVFNNVINCPRCNEKLVSGTKVCSNCGFELDGKATVVSNIRFGFNADENTTVTINAKKTISKTPTKAITAVTKVKNVLMFLVGIVSVLILFFPIYSANNNIWDRIDLYKSYYGCPTLSDNLHLHGWSNSISILVGLIRCLANNEVYDSVSTILVIYEFATLAMLVAIAAIGVFLLVNAIRGLIINKIIYQNKRLMGVNLTLLLTLMFAFGCYNAYVIVCLVIYIASFIALYISDIFAKDKPFLLKNLIHKSICFALLFVLLIFSSIGLVNLDVGAGSDLFHTRPLKDTIESPAVFGCNGLFLELTQYIQCFAGDKHFSTIALLTNLGNFVFHTTYLAFVSMAIVSLLKSLSNQSVRFPIKYIVISTIAFYLFAFTVISFNQLVNNAAHQNYISQLPTGIDVQTPKVYMLSARMIISMVLNLPVCIYCVVAKNICLRRESYYK